ncbi:MAG: amidohydrolase [Clostridia bacterium]|nr:amidohydrolase [Clostridia bacterium]
MTIVNEIKKLEEELIALRRELHRYPEIGGNLPRTRKIVCAYLDSIGVSYTLNPDEDGLIADICGIGDGKTLAFRADMDALHIDEKTGLEYSSELDGQMHGCGHDAHTAMLLVTAKLLSQHRDSFCGRVRLLFQSGEETGTGAKAMLALGALEGVDGICAIHVGNLAGESLTNGKIVVKEGPVSAGKDKFTVTVRGKGTHSAFTDKGVDPILIAARIVNGCEEINARELPAGSAAVLSFGSLTAGVDHNSIPETAVIKGSIRVQSVELRNFMGERLKTVAESIAHAFRGECTVDLHRGSSTVMNDKALANIVKESAEEILGEEIVTETPSALMGSDDFANYTDRIPGVYYFLCTNNPDKNIVETNHNPAFDVDESVLWKGVASYVATALKFLNK